MATARPREPFSFLELARALTVLFLLLVGIAKAVSLLGSSDIEYESSEWIVSYAAGFIRRGLLGEFVLGAAALTGLDSMVVVKIIAPASLLAFIWLFIARIVRTPGLNRDERFFLLFMPAGLSFILMNGHVIIRKDYLVLIAFLGFLALIERAGPLRIWPVLIYLATVGSVAVLVHEIFFFFCLPYAAVLLYARLQSPGVHPRRALLPLAGILAVPVLVTVIALTAPPKPGDLLKVCEHAMPLTRGLECTPLPEALSYLEQNQHGAIRASYREMVRTKLWGLPAGIVWIAFALPFAWMHFEVLCRMIAAHLGAGRWRDARLTASALFLLNTILFFGMTIIGFDVGRWIFLLTSLATLSMTSAPCAIGLAGAVSSLGIGNWEPRIPQINPRFYGAFVLAGAFISLVFKMNYCCVYRMIDWFWLVRDVLEYLKIIPSVVNPVVTPLPG